MKLGVRCVVFSEGGQCLYEGKYAYQDNEIDLLHVNGKFHVLASRNVFRNYVPHSTSPIYNPHLDQTDHVEVVY